MRQLLLFISIFFAMINVAAAHNGVRLEQDSCVFKVGSVGVHFVAYQIKGEGEDLCDDIPDTGKTIFGISAIGDQYRNVKIGARLAQQDGQTLMVFEPKPYNNATLTFENTFAKAGKYSMFVTVVDDLGNKQTSEFPFTVGVYTVSNMMSYILYVAGFGLLLFFLRFMLKPKDDEVFVKQ